MQGVSGSDGYGNYETGGIVPMIPGSVMQSAPEQVADVGRTANNTAEGGENA